jgi:3'(2'), 5'-bisphosphate nucleotidase
MAPISHQQQAAICETLLRCGQQARAAAAQPFDVFEKGVEDYVTNVDRQLDQILAATFAQLFPQDGVITEENRQSAQAFQGDRDRLWCIDPIDGTEDYIHRGDNYALMVGLLVNQRPLAGWIYGPVHRCLYWGGPGWGLFQQGADGQTQPLHPQAPPDPTAATCPIIVGDRDQRRFGEALAIAAPQLRPYALGSYGLKVMEVIKGQAGLYIYLNGRVKLWDTTGPLALALAAGLVCCDLDGQPIRFDASSICPGSLIHRQPILIGWPQYIDHFRLQIRQAVLTIRRQELQLSEAIIPPPCPPSPDSAVARSA